MCKKIAILGAGLSGLTLATKLKDHAEVTVFEKSHSVGGRMSTRVANTYSLDLLFNHGAQYFSVKSKAFAEFLKPFIDQNIVAQWHPKLVEIGENAIETPVTWTQPRYIALPGMRGLCEALSDGLDIELNHKIVQIDKRQDGHWLRCENGRLLGAYDWVITSMPSHQAAAILPTASPIQSALANVKMKGCYALMLGFEHPLNITWDAASRPKLAPQDAISWVAVNPSKQKTDEGSSLLAQTSNDWADQRLEEDQDKIKDILLHDLETLLELKLPARAYEELHKWRYANVSKAADQDYLMDEVHQLAACGDWCLHGKVEAAYSSAAALAKKLLP